MHFTFLPRLHLLCLLNPKPRPRPIQYQPHFNLTAPLFSYPLGQPHYANAVTNHSHPPHIHWVGGRDSVCSRAVPGKTFSPTFLPYLKAKPNPPFLHSQHYHPTNLLLLSPQSCVPSLHLFQARFWASVAHISVVQLYVMHSEHNFDPTTHLASEIYALVH